jgi:anti-sigma factor RsiW
MTCPAPESLVALALGEKDPTISRHVATCAVCQAELARLQEGVGLLRAETAFQRRTETPDCLEESAIADFVDGRLTPEERAPRVAHLLTCARCRSLVRGTGALLADDAVAKAIPKAVDHRWRRWSLPVGLAAAAAVLLLVWPRSTEHTESTPGLRDSTPTIINAPVLIAPRASVARVDRFVWSSVPGVERYRLRLYDGEGALVWTAETADTVAALPDSVALSAPGTYFWKVEAQTEWGRWAGSELTEFRLLGSKR